ncbi:hypothetical protein CSAL01_11603 [Colletotrichum salicis]|uniref:Uncharacterized protein n=1 Tax=Colletotrichum salicis TaxID=1209931 RepID=A0A135V2E7_9PEZI|nr:hypothetical protein CSAL01_11603 [Colletotrichum salicis]
MPLSAKEERKDTGTQNFKIKEKQKPNFAEKHYNRLGLENRHTWNGWKQSLKHPERSLEPEDSSEKESDAESENEAKDGRVSGKKATSINVGSQSLPAAGVAVDMEQYQQFLKFQKMISSGGK